MHLYPLSDTLRPCYLTLSKGRSASATGVNVVEIETAHRRIKILSHPHPPDLSFGTNPLIRLTITGTAIANLLPLLSTLHAALCQ